jgi:NAD-dependent dihydropyrimidine dehydrogenase PreA subunit
VSDNTKIISSEKQPSLNVTRIGQARAMPPVRGEALLRPLESIWIRLSGFVSRAFPVEFNPFAQLGAVANTMFIVALVTGILLLIWYSPSVNGAYDSVLAMQQSPYLVELLRSLHRYSSDVCILFIILHAFQMLGARKFGGARWVAWLSGMLLLGLVWMDGWTGYWLVWDERARQIALGTANFLDVLPFFPEPLLRSFLTNDGLNSLFFFIVFFIHMLIPMGVVAFLWIHIMRLNAARFFTSVRMGLALLGVLIITSLMFPATLAAPADMTVVPQDLQIDWLFMMPLWFTERLSGSVLWVVLFFTTVALWGIPWWLTKGNPEPAVVNEASCNGCTQCVQDCPFNAIDMIDLEEPRSGITEFARVNLDKCVGCGVCVGSCDSSSINQSTIPVMDVRKFVSQLEEDVRHVAFICAESAGERFPIDENGSCEALPGYRVVPVSCVGWVHMLTIERALRRGAEGVLVAGCGVDPACRSGADYTGSRLAGDREPWLRVDHVDPSKVIFVRFDRTDPKGLIDAAAAFRSGKPVVRMRKTTSPLKRGAAAAVVGLSLTASTVLLSDGPYQTPQMEHSAFVVSFKHAGDVVTSTTTDQVDDSDVLPHMRRERPVERIRVPVRLRITVDDSVHVLKSFNPGGLFDDGLSVGISELELPVGIHSLTVEIDNTSEADSWAYEWSGEMPFAKAQRRVLVFDEDGRFVLH